MSTREGKSANPGSVIPFRAGQVFSIAILFGPADKILYYQYRLTQGLMSYY